MSNQPNRDKSRRMRRHAAVSFIVSLISISCLIDPRGVYSPEASGEWPVRTNAAVVPPKGGGESPAWGRAYVNVDAPLPYLRRGSPAERSHALRGLVIAGAGFDFLAKCGDMLRLGAAKPSKPGAIYRSRHKTGEAFDYNQEDPRLLLVRDNKAGRTYWRTYLRCERQDGTMGFKADLRTDNAGSVSAYVFDFTAAAEGLGWERIPAKEGWGRAPSKKEYWHYQMTDSSFERAANLINVGQSGEEDR